MTSEIQTFINFFQYHITSVTSVQCSLSSILSSISSIATDKHINESHVDDAESDWTLLVFHWMLLEKSHSFSNCFLVEGLVELVEKDENLCKKLLDPRYVLALNELQQNPVVAMQKYKDDEELQDFLRQFCGILGEELFEANFLFTKKEISFYSQDTY